MHHLLYFVQDCHYIFLREYCVVQDARVATSLCYGKTIYVHSMFCWGTVCTPWPFGCKPTLKYKKLQNQSTLKPKWSTIKYRQPLQPCGYQWKLQLSRYCWQTCQTKTQESVFAIAAMWQASELKANCSNNIGMYYQYLNELTIICKLPITCTVPL